MDRARQFNQPFVTKVVSRGGTLCALSLVFTVVSSLPVGAAEPTSAPPTVSFRRDVVPIPVARCPGCHGPEKVKGDYRLDTFAALVQPGSSESAPLTPGKPADSELYRLIATHDE